MKRWKRGELVDGKTKDVSGNASKQRRVCLQLRCVGFTMLNGVDEVIEMNE